METCRDCPQQYPWLGDSEGTGIVNNDNYNFNGNNDPDTEQSEGAEESRKKQSDRKKKKNNNTKLNKIGRITEIGRGSEWQHERRKKNRLRLKRKHIFVGQRIKITITTKN